MLAPRLAAPVLCHAGLVMRGPAWHEGRPVLYVTLDDGPDAEGSPHLLDALAAHDARATVFLRGDRAEARPDLVRQWLEAGHAPGLHGYAHRSAWRTPRAALLADHDRAAAVLDGLAGRTVRLCRPPYGRVSPALVRWAARSGRRLVLWDLLGYDFRPARSPAVLARFARAYARPGSVLVLHDGAPARRAAQALHHLLPALAADGWCFRTLPERTSPRDPTS
ncbi:MAG: polysaccharide deacetylase family protein [Rubricoccaceae bacterium]